MEARWDGRGGLSTVLVLNERSPLVDYALHIADSLPWDSPAGILNTPATELICDPKWRSLLGTAFTLVLRVLSVCNEYFRKLGYHLNSVYL